MRHIGIVSSLTDGSTGPTPPDVWSESFPGVSPGDDGFFAWLRTRYGTVSELVHAQEGGMAKILYSSASYTNSYPYRRCTNNRNGTHTTPLEQMSISSEANNEWFGWDFGESTKMDVSHYSLRCAYSSISPRSWEAEWSDDGSSWTSFDSHSSDTTMNSGTDAWYTFTPASNSGPHRYFRFRTTGGCADGRNFFAVSGVEFYGDASITLEAVSGVDLRYSPDNIIGAIGYLSRLRNTESYAHAEVGTTYNTGVGQSVGRGLIEVSGGGHYYPDANYNSMMTYPEWSNSGYYLTALNSYSGFFGVNFGKRIRVRPTHYNIGYREGYYDHIREWTFEGSNDGFTWDVLDDQTNQLDLYAQEAPAYTYGHNYQVFSVPETATFYQFFKIQPVESAAGSGDIGLSSFDVFGDYEEDVVALPSGATRYNHENLVTALDGIHANEPVGVFSTAPSYEYAGQRNPRNLVDQSLSSPFYTNNASGGNCAFDYWPNKVRPELIILFGGAQGYNVNPIHLDVEGSDDGVTWTTLRSMDDNVLQNYGWRYSDSAQPISVLVNSDTEYRFLRILQTGVNSRGDNYFGLSEVEVYGDVVPQSVPGTYNPEEVWSPLAVVWADDPNWTNPGNGNPVASWRNGGILGTDFTESTNKPTFVSSVAAINNKAALLGSNGGNTKLHADGFISRSSAHSFVFIGSMPGSIQSHLMHQHTPGSRSFYRQGGSHEFTMYAGGNNPVVPGDDDIHLFVLYWDEGNSVLEVDGVSYGPANPGSGGLCSDITLMATSDGSQATDGHLALFMMTHGDIKVDTRYPDFKQWVRDFYGLTIS